MIKFIRANFLHVFLFNISFSELGRMQSHQMILKSVERGGVEVEVA